MRPNAVILAFAAPVAPAEPLFAPLGNVLRILAGPVARRAVTANPEAHGTQIAFGDAAPDLLGAFPDHLRKMSGGRGETGLAVIIVVHFHQASTELLALRSPPQARFSPM